jgi:hypothetical protein
LFQQAISIVSRIEVLGFPGWSRISQEARVRLHEVVASMIERPVSESTIQRSPCAGKRR